MWNFMPAELVLDGSVVQVAHYDHYLVVYETPVSEREEYRQLAESLCNYWFVPPPWFYCEADCIWPFTGMLQARRVCEWCEKPLLPTNLNLHLNFNFFFTLSSSLVLIATHESFVSAYNSYQVPQEHKNIHSNKHYCNCHLFMMCRGICVQDCQLFICTKSDTFLQGSQFFIKLSSPWVSSVKSRQAQRPTRTWWSADCCTEKTQDQG